MLIAGTGGLGKEILGILLEDGFSDDIVFFDENINAPNLLYNKFPVIKSYQELERHFALKNKIFITGIGNPRIREKLTLKIEKAGGVSGSVISKRTSIFPFNCAYNGVIIQPGVGISHNVALGHGTVVHINSTIGHGITIGNYVNIGPNVSLIGPASIGDYSYISAQATILPNISIGKNAIISAGKIVTRNIENLEIY